MEITPCAAASPRASTSSRLARSAGVKGIFPVMANRRLSARPGVDAATSPWMTKRILELESRRWLASNGQRRSSVSRPNRVLYVLLMESDAGGSVALRTRGYGRAGALRLPIIALTAGALSSERQRATDAGMDDFIVKPFSAEALVRSIVRHVKPANGRPAPVVGGDEPATPGGTTEPRPWPEITGIDAADVRARLGDDLELFGSMLGHLFDEFSDVAIPATTNDPAVLADHAGRMHKLRGSAGMLGAKTIQALAAEAAACVARQGTEPLCWRPGWSPSCSRFATTRHPCSTPHEPGRRRGWPRRAPRSSRGSCST